MHNMFQRKVDVLTTNRRCLEYQVKILYFFGIWPISDGTPHNFMFYWRYFYPRLELIRTAYAIPLHLVAMSFVWGQALLVMEDFLSIMAHSLILVKFATMFYYRERLANMIKTFEKLNLTSDEETGKIKKIRQKTELICHMFSKYVFISVLLLCVILTVPMYALAFQKKAIPFRRWFPYDVSKSPMFELSAIFTLTLAIFDMNHMFICDVLFLVLLVHNVAQFKILRHRLEHMREIVETKLRNNQLAQRRKRSNNAQQGPQIHKITNVFDFSSNGNEPNFPSTTATLSKPYASNVKCPNHGNLEVRSTNEVKTSIRIEYNKDTALPNILPIDTKPTNNNSSIHLVPKNKNKKLNSQVQGISHTTLRRVLAARLLKEVNDEMELSLGKCVSHHQLLLGLSQEMQKIFNTMLVFQVLANVLLSMLALYVHTLAESMDIKVILVIMCLGGGVLEMFLYCVAANNLTDESVNVMEAAYACNWVDATEGFKRSLRILMSRTLKPIILKSGGIPLSMATFKKVIKAAYHANIMITKFMNGEKIMKSKNT